MYQGIWFRPDGPSSPLVLYPSNQVLFLLGPIGPISPLCPLGPGPPRGPIFTPFVTFEPGVVSSLLSHHLPQDLLEGPGTPGKSEYARQPIPSSRSRKARNSNFTPFHRVSSWSWWPLSSSTPGGPSNPGVTIDPLSPFNSRSRWPKWSYFSVSSQAFPGSPGRASLLGNLANQSPGKPGLP